MKVEIDTELYIIRTFVFFLLIIIATDFITHFPVCICSFPQKIADRPSPAYVYMQQQQHYIPPPQQVMFQQMCHQVHGGNGHQASVHTLSKKGSMRNGDVLKRTRTQNG